jgi:hypothetical protein
MAKAKTFKSTTGYPVTVWAPDASGSAMEIRVGADDDPFETDDKDTIAALEGSSDVAEVKGGKN